MTYLDQRIEDSLQSDDMLEHFERLQEGHIVNLSKTRLKNSRSDYLYTYLFRAQN